MLNASDERDDDRDEDDEDADQSKKDNSADDKDEDEDDADDKDEDSDDADDDDESDEDEDDDKPVTRKELRDLLRKNGNKDNANRRVHSKDRKPDRRNISQSPKTEERISEVEKTLRKTQLLETKRTFGYENSLSPAQVDVVFRMTKRPTAKFLKEPYVKAALDTIASQSNVRDNTPSGSGKSFRSQGGKSWDKLDPKEKQDSFADRRRAILASKRG